jgi:lipoate-protein ligase B
MNTYRTSALAMLKLAEFKFLNLLQFSTLNTLLQLDMIGIVNMQLLRLSDLDDRVSWDSVDSAMLAHLLRL